ncbi:uncharacterized protein [Montipora capricornis]|uniref:uncharacterized protein n=1 Tax=Montipora capricornis TaxID=246305 RepID=UPI0035F136DB
MDVSRATEPCPSRVSSRTRRPIATVDQGVYLERLHSKKNIRAGYVSNVAAKVGEITEMLVDDQNLQTVKDKLVHAVVAFDKFKEAHFDYWSEVRDTGRMEECRNYLTKHVSDFDTFRDRVNGWIAQAEHRLLVSAFDVDSEVNSEDSVSRVDSPLRSGSSRHSSRLSSRTSRAASVEAARVKEAARFAELEAEKAMLEKRQVLEERKFRLSQEEVRLNLEVEIAKSAAKGQALAGIFTPPGQPPVHPFSQEPEYMLARQLRESTLRDTTGPPVVDTDFSTDPDYLQLEAVTLQRQQIALQAQQNRIVELLAVNQNKTELPQPRVLIFDGNPVDYRSFIRAFENLIQSRTCSSTERLYSLGQYTTGDVKELIKSCHHLPPDVGYQEARKLLKKSCKNAPAGSQYASKFDQPGNIQKLIFKLPFNTRERWRRRADDIMERQLRPVEFNDLVAFMDREARIATNPVFGNISGNAQPFFNSRERKPSQPPVGFRSSKPKTTTFATQVKTNQSMNSEKNPCADLASSDVPSIVCIFYQQNHALEDCHLLRWKPYQERIKFLSAKRLCFRCLSEKHVARLCPERKICKIPNCTRKHPTVLHTSNVREKSSVDVGIGTGDSADTPVLNAMANTEKCSSSLDFGEARTRTAMAVIPVKIRLKSSNQTIITYAFLDNGSSATFCTESLMRKLGVDGTKVKISLSTLEKKNSPVDSYLIRDLVVSDLDENHFVHLPTLYIRPKTPVSKEDIPTQEEVAQWPHLGGLFIPQIDADIGLLIASDVPEALDPVEVKHSQNGGPYATRTCMGWAVNGSLGRFRGRSHTSSFFLKVDPQLQQMVESFYNRDFVDLLADDTKEMSQDEHRFMENAEKIQFKEGHYEIPLPFKNHASLIPNNKSHALVRVEWLKRKLERDPKLCDDYQVVMKELLDKGYARKVPPDQLNPVEGSAWYIPHHGVYHPHKPGKIRLVFDCSAKFRGISLNSMLHKGPDLTNSLIGVLTRFRGERVAVMADIESMFHQVRVPEHDSSFLRFLWWDDGNLAGKIVQELCRIKLGWDDEIPPEYYSSWEKWLADVPKLSSFSICRSVLPEAFGPVVSSQLHHFSDASEAAYGSISYLRLVDEEGRVHCSFLFAKSRLAPLKSVSIPRLELSAATLSVRHDKMLKREIEMSFSDPCVFWTDSMSVLRYVKNESKRFHTFVANRITTIRDGSTPDQWYHVEGAMNPGDHTSRRLSADAFLNCTEWVLGPEFLWKCELKWPKLTDSSITIPSGDPEVKQTAFPAEIHQLTGPSGSKHVRRSSPLFKLDPVLRNGLLCVGGRLSWARISLDAKIILPKNDHVSNLIINHYHTLSGHSGRQHVLSLLRQRYWVIKANSAVREILTKCYRCRKREAPFCEQKMADLPEDRLVPDRPPFTIVGVDCFAPFHVRRARILVKRYGVIFTCMTIRALHIEIAHSLDTRLVSPRTQTFHCQEGPSSRVTF